MFRIIICWIDVRNFIKSIYKIGGKNMEMNVWDVMIALKICNVKLVSGASGLNNHVTGINIIESKNIMQVITGGEVLITSLYPLMLNPYKPEEFCEILAQANVSALAIKVGNAFDKIPKKVLDVGEKYGMPIIELPKDSNFSNIIHLVVLALYDKKSLKLQTHKMVFEQLSNIILEGKGLEALILAFAKVLGKHIILVNRHERVILSSRKVTGKYLWKQYKKKEILLDNRIVAYKTIADSAGENKEYSLILPIYQMQECKAFLIIEPFKADITDVEISIIEDGMKMVSIEMLKKEAIIEVENRYKYDLLDVIIGDENFEEALIKEKLESTGWNFFGNFIVAVIETDERKENETGKGSSYLISDYISDSPEINIVHYMRVKSNQLYLILQKEEKDKLIAEAQKICSDIMQFIKENINDDTRIGLGGVAGSIKEIHRSYQEALEAIYIGRIIGKEYTDFSKLGIMKILYNTTNRQMMEEAVPQGILRLYEYDQKNNSTLLTTLQVYFDMNCNASKAAEKLFIHYKTMLYRLEKIKGITGICLENSQERLEAEIGIKILKLYK